MRKNVLDLQHKIFNALHILNDVNEQLKQLYTKHLIADGFKEFEVVSEGVYYDGLLEFFTKSDREGYHFYWVVQPTSDSEFYYYHVYEIVNDQAFVIMPNTINTPEYDDYLKGLAPMLYKGQSPFQTGDKFYAKPIVEKENI